jgi:glutamate racemase
MRRRAFRRPRWFEPDLIPRAPKILVFDSGLGGLTVHREILPLRPSADFVYCADDAGFPYGSWPEPALIDHIIETMARLIADHAPDMVVIACNTASTLVLPHLRARWPELPFVGTVPAIKPAAAQSKSRKISVLATPGTVARDYTQQLVETFAAHCEVRLVGSKHLAGLAERHMHGEPAQEAAIAAEIAPCFVEDARGRTDVVTLACTHYPLLLDIFRKLAPWPVTWIDPAPAIAKRADQLLVEKFGEDARAGTGARRIIFTSGKPPEPGLAAALAAFGFFEPVAGA